MNRIALIALLTFYSLGTILSPMGDFSFLPKLSAMYDHCSKEDPDINAVDFVFEHLLNLEDVMDHFEGCKENEEHEKPHAPVQQLQTVSPVMITLSKPIQLELKQSPFIPYEVTTYPLHKDYLIQFVHLSSVFRPPIA